MNQKHLLQMLAICIGVIVIGVAMVSVFGLGANNAVFLGLLILCPLSHLLMMRSMKNNQGSINHEQEHSSIAILNKNEEKSNVQNCH